MLAQVTPLPVIAAGVAKGPAVVIRCVATRAWLEPTVQPRTACPVGASARTTGQAVPVTTASPEPEMYPCGVQVPSAVPVA